jgi:HAD superfamily hydrolase (TIGR01662 family)
VVFLEIGNTRYKWNGNSINKSSINDLGNELIRIGISHNSFNLILEYKLLKAIFFDLGNTLIKTTFKGSNITNITIFPETQEIISSLKNRGIKLGIISNGSRTHLSEWLDDQNSELNQLFNKFDVVIMSDDDVGVRKPHKEIFKKAILQLDANLDPLSTAFISDDIDINHFKVYNLLFVQNLREISSYV